jgi:hypothetical protein
MPLRASFPKEIVIDVFRAHGIHVLMEHSDGRIMWGDELPLEPYGGKFFPIDVYYADRYDVIRLRAVVRHFGKDAEWRQVEDELWGKVSEKAE